MPTRQSDLTAALCVGLCCGCLCAPIAWTQPTRPTTASTAPPSSPVASSTQGTAWSFAGRGPGRVSAVDVSSEPGPPPLWAGWPTVTIDSMPDGTPIEFMTRTSPVVQGGDAFVLAWVDGYETLVAVDLLAGSVRWAAELPPLVTDSWSSPAIDAQHHTVLVGVGDEVIALGTRTGRVKWRTTLLGPVVNASPIVTDDLGPRDRAFVTDYGYLSDAGRLYCLNTDPYDATLNPYQPGEIVWSVVIDSVSSGNSPAYANGTVYVATPGNGFSGGSVLAFDTESTSPPHSPPSPAWVFNNTNPTGFFGGVSVRRGAVFAATYGFGGGQLNSNIVKLSAQTGALLWSAPSNRTSSTPVPLADGRVVLSGGILPDPVFGDYGSRPSIAVYEAMGTLTLETALHTWTDADQDGSIDPGEALLLGGWTHQPVVIESASGHAEAIVAVSPTTSLPGLGGVGLARLDLDWTPGSPTPLISQASPLGGGSAAAPGGWLLSAGPSGLTIWRPRLVGGTP
ncbi:MAG: outer membrane protein assembly factor BamB [Phycisphaerales bacterium]|jgi:outer membrane protein assembly factor BamB